jgi:glycosyltransferase involved in cell wall biosynthesis
VANGTGSASATQKVAESVDAGQRDIPVSVIVMTKNEERNIAQCLAGVARFREVFVVDSGSEDRTCDLALENGAQVVQFRWDGGYPKKKQWSLENLPFTHDWVLYVDADEVVTPELAEEIGEVVAATQGRAGYFVGYDYVFLGRVLRHGRRVYKLALLDRRRARFLDYDDLDAANMWEVEGHYQPEIQGSTGTLRHRMVHRDHDSLFRYFERHNRYSDWEAVVREKGALQKAGEAQPPLRTTAKAVFNRLPMKGLISFFFYYVIKLGFLDGRAGLNFALANSFYYWQTSLKRAELRMKRKA